MSLIVINSNQPQLPSMTEETLSLTLNKLASPLKSNFPVRRLSVFRKTKVKGMSYMELSGGQDVPLGGIWMCMNMLTKAHFEQSLLIGFGIKLQLRWYNGPTSKCGYMRMLWIQLGLSVGQPTVQEMVVWNHFVSE